MLSRGHQPPLDDMLGLLRVMEGLHSGDAAPSRRKWEDGAPGCGHRGAVGVGEMGAVTGHGRGEEGTSL